MFVYIFANEYWSKRIFISSKYREIKARSFDKTLQFNKIHELFKKIPGFMYKTVKVG
jgi:hypothetical protein